MHIWYVFVPDENIGDDTTTYPNIMPLNIPMWPIQKKTKTINQNDALDVCRQVTKEIWFKKSQNKKTSAENYPDRNPLQTQIRSKENTKRRKNHETPKTVLEKNYPM